MCPDFRGWRRFYLQYVTTLLQRHDFDGLWRLLGEVRGLLGPQRLMVIHNGESQFLATPNNYADMIVTLEDVSSAGGFRYDLKGIARVLRAFLACRVGMVPCSTWYRVPPPEPRQTGLRDGTAKGLLLGSVPYIYTWREPAWGYRDNWDALADPRGLYAVLRQLKALGLDELRFDDYFTGVVRCNRKDVMGARYHGNGRQVVVIANLARRDLANPLAVRPVRRNHL